MIGYANIHQLKVSQEYQENDDYMLLEGSGEFMRAEKGTFAVFFPEDAHMPGIMAECPEQVEKIVIKIRI